MSVSVELLLCEFVCVPACRDVGKEGRNAARGVTKLERQDSCCWLLTRGSKTSNTQTHTYSHSQTLPHITYWRIDASKMPNEINIASNAAWQCKCICKINRCIYLGEGFIIVSMPVCVRLCASSCCDAKNNAYFVFAILFACARMAVCVCVSGALTPKNLPYYAYALHDYQLSTCNVLNSKQTDVFLILDIRQKQQHLH